VNNTNFTDLCENVYPDDGPGLKHVKTAIQRTCCNTHTPACGKGFYLQYWNI